MTATTTQPNLRMSFQLSARSDRQAELELCEAARALALAERLALARQERSRRRQPVGDLTAQLAAAWALVRLARALTTPDKPPTSAGAIRVSRGAHRGGDHPVDRFLLDRCVSDPGGRVSLADLARALRAYTTDGAERDDLPTPRQLARQLRARGLSVQQAGPRVWVCGVRLGARDENGYMPEPTSDSDRG